MYKYCLIIDQLMNTLRPVLDKDLITKILEIKPKYITTTAFLNLLLEDAYNARCKNEKNMALYIHKDNKFESKKLDNKSLDKDLERKEQKEKINKKEKQEKNIPDDLKHLQTLIDDFWKVKKGSKSIQAWKLQITEYRKFIHKYGEQVLRDQLEAGILAGTWKGLKMSHYEEQMKRVKRFDKEPEKEVKHPAQRVVQFDEMGNLI